MSVPQNQTATNIIKAQISDLKRRVRLWKEKYGRHNHYDLTVLETHPLAAENVPMLQAEVEHLRSAVEPIYTQNDALATPQTRARMDTANKVSVVLAPEGEAQRPIDRLEDKSHSLNESQNTHGEAVATVTQWEKQCQGRENDPVGTQLLIKDYELRADRLEEENRVLKQELKEAQNTNRKAVKTVARWEKQCQDLKDGHAVTRSVLAYHFNEEKRLQIERQCHLLNANRDAMETAARWEKQCQDLKSNYAVAQSSAKDADQLRAQLEQDMRRLIILEAENGKLKAQKETLDAEKVTLASELATQASDILQLREVVELLQASLKHAESVDTKNREELEFAHETISSLKAVLLRVQA